MKKFRILMGALALAMAAVVIIACNKEKAEIKTFAETETISKEDDMSAYLKHFKEKMQSAAKGDETLSMEDARWHLEAVLNYTYGDAGRQISDIQCDTFYYVLPINGDEVSLAQLNEAFDSLSADVEKSLATCDLPDKSILAIQTRLKNDRRDDFVVIQVTMDVRGCYSGAVSIPFGLTDYWFENEGAGKCGPYLGECVGMGAVQALESKINSNLPAYQCFQGHGYFTDFDSIAIEDSYIYHYLEDSLSPYGYRIHYHGCPTWQFPTCLSPDDLNYYLVEALKLVNELKPVGNEIVRMTNEYYEAVPIGYRFGYHHYTFIYGKYNCSGSGGGNDY